MVAVQVLESVAMFHTDVFVGDGESSFTNAVTEWRRCVCVCVCVCIYVFSLEYASL
jgi:hypothetical protein